MRVARNVAIAASMVWKHLPIQPRARSIMCNNAAVISFVRADVSSAFLAK